MGIGVALQREATVVIFRCQSSRPAMFSDSPSIYRTDDKQHKYI